MKVDILNTQKTYEIIYADPPWSYKDKRCNGAALNHYQTMNDNNICDLPIQKLAAEDSVLFMWATYPKYAEALQVIKSWGFKYKTIAFQWVKTNKSVEDGRMFLNERDFFLGLGRWTRGNTEPCLLATRGKPKRVNKAVRQLIVSPLSKHSEKPARVRNEIIKLMGGASAIELFARKEAPGWDCWGNEV
jgi:N6-adenosine-specific RNA methylase IME4